MQVIGVLLAAIASVISNLGLNFQKLSHAKAHTNAEDDSKRNYLTDRIWILGLLLVIFGSVFDFVALAFAAQSIVRL